jgi:hypothetical protein
MIRTSTMACGIAVGMAMMLASIAEAQEKPLDFTVCRSGTVTPLLPPSKDATVFSVDATGITVNSSDKMFENQTSRCLGVGSNIAGKSAGNGYCKYVDPDGDVNVLAFTSDKPGEGTWRFVHGTGKWHGARRAGSFKFFTRGKPIAEGTTQSCNRVTGTYELKN